MTTPRSTAASALLRRALLLHGVAMAVLAAFSPVTAAAETQMKTATTQPDTAQRSAADATRPFRVHVPEKALVDLRRRHPPFPRPRPGKGVTSI